MNDPLDSKSNKLNTSSDYLDTESGSAAEDQENFRKVFHHAADPILIISGETFVDCNGAAVKLLNASSKAEVLSTHPSQLSPEFQPDGQSSFTKANKILEMTFQTGFSRFEWMHTKITGEVFPVEVSLTTILRKDETVLHVLWKDLTKQKALENNLISSAEAAEAANIAKSHFLANMSHEIRTPMNGVLGMAEMLDRTVLTEKQTHYVHAIQKSGEHLLGIINDILDFSKLEAGMMKLDHTALNLQEILQQVLHVLSVQVNKKGIELKLEYISFSPTILFGDPGKIKQVLLNIVGNAVKFTKEGSVTIVVEQFDSDTQTNFKFSIEDTGIGIPIDKIEHLFDEFTQADTSSTRDFGGTGLGLAISQNLVNLMNGEIGANNMPNGGARFWFSVPLKTGKKSIGTPGLPVIEYGVEKIENAESNEGKRIRALLIEDNLSNQNVAKEMLDLFSCEIRTANNGLEGLEIFKNESFDIIFMDVQMPKMNGIETTQAIRKLTDKTKASIPIIAMTAHALVGDKEQCLNAGMNDYMSKPFTIDDFENNLLKWSAYKPQ